MQDAENKAAQCILKSEEEKQGRAFYQNLPVDYFTVHTLERKVLTEGQICFYVQFKKDSNQLPWLQIRGSHPYMGGRSLPGVKLLGGIFGVSSHK